MNRTKNWKQLRVLGVVSVALTTLIAGCGGQEPAPSDKTPTAVGEKEVPKEPLKLSMMNMYYTPEPPKADNEAVKLIEAHTNTKLDITWVPNSAYNDKINATIAGGELPKIMMIASNKSSGIVNAVKSGMFWEVGPYLKDYPNLSKLNPLVLNNISIDGKIYGIYRSRPVAREGIIYRKDWLDAVGLSEPKTIDDFYNMVKAFATKDPDKNGKDDTFGMYEGRGMNGFQTILAWNGGPNLYGLQDGKVVPDFMTKEYIDALKLYKRMYDEKLINQDFAVVPGTKRQETVNQGKAGLIISTLDDVNAGFNDLVKANPSAVLDVASRIKGPKGERLMLYNGGYVGVYMFPKTSIKTEQELKQILGFLDKLGDKKLQNLFEWGVEGKHFKVENGKPTRTDGKAYETDINSIYQLRYDDGSQTDAGEDAPIVKKYKQMFQKNTEIAIANPAESFESATLAEKGSELTKIVQDARVKYIMGTIDEAGWNQAVDQWRKSGGDKVIEEYTAQYNKQKK